MSSQLFFVRNSGKGSVLKPTRGPTYWDSCVAPTFGQQLSAVQCSIKDEVQQWSFVRVRTNIYQIRQVSSGSCLRAQSTGDGSNVSLGRCNYFDNMQLWRICTSK